MNFLKNPRSAPPGNRSLWLGTWMFEWGLVLTIGSLALGFFAFIERQKPAAEIAIVIGAPMAILTAFGGWAMQVYLSKSKSRGPNQPDGREGGG